MGWFSYNKPREVETVYLPELVKKLPSMADKTVVITGTTSGTGFVAAKVIAGQGAKVLCLNRASSRAENSLKLLKEQVPDGKFESVVCDLMDFDSVRQAAKEVKSTHDAVDVLVLNAGVMALKDERTKDGYDVQSQTNCLSHFLLTKELYPELKKAAEENGEARVVHHSSGARKLGNIEAKYMEKCEPGTLGGDGTSFQNTFMRGGRWERYCFTKLYNATFAQELARKFEAQKVNIKSIAAAPGLAATNLQSTSVSDGGMIHWFTNLLMRMSQSGEDGACGIIHASCMPDAKSGEFYEPGGKGNIYGPAESVHVRSIESSEEKGELLWKCSEDAVGEFQLSQL